MNIPLWQTEWKLYVGFAASYFDFLDRSIQSQRLQAVAYSVEDLSTWARQQAQEVADKANALVSYYDFPFSSTLEETRDSLQKLAKVGVFVQTEEVTL